jgi:hypothetical protein
MAKLKEGQEYRREPTVVNFEGQRTGAFSISLR